MISPPKPIQTGGIFHAWQSPDGNFSHPFVKLDLECDPDGYPGVLILADENRRNAIATTVTNLRKELPRMLEERTGKTVAYWWYSQEAARILSGLTRYPVFLG